MYQHNRITDVKTLLAILESFVDDSKTTLSLLANSVALLKQYYPETNWIGYYLAKGNTLHLGPFIGESACIEIAFGKGVCGSSANLLETIIVNDTSEFADHIACDVNSQSEIVLPIIIDNIVYGVLDIDSPKKNTFTDYDKEILETFIEILKKGIRKSLF
ncbi:MAG: GAF domain-containing protein [Erysipelotrichaceae bacterium]